MLRVRDSKTAFDITAGASGAIATRSPASTVDPRIAFRPRAADMRMTGR